jgi:hypothetical protein
MTLLVLLNNTTINYYFDLTSPRLFSGNECTLQRSVASGQWTWASRPTAVSFGQLSQDELNLLRGIEKDLAKEKQPVPDFKLKKTTSTSLSQDNTKDSNPVRFMNKQQMSKIRFKKTMPTSLVQKNQNELNIIREMNQDIVKKCDEYLCLILCDDIFKINDNKDMLWLTLSNFKSWFDTIIKQVSQDILNLNLTAFVA